MPEPREPRRYDRERAKLRKRLVRYVELDLTSKNWLHVKKAARDAARQYYEEFPEHCRDPELLTNSFMGRFDASDGVKTLLRKRVLDLGALSRAISGLYVHYNDGTLPTVTPSVALRLFKKKLSPKDLAQRAKVLREASRIIWDASESTLAVDVRMVAARYEQALRASGKPARRRAGALPSPAGSLAQWLDLVMDELDQASRHRLISQLVTEFVTKKSTRAIRELLRDRYKRVR